MGQHHSKNEKRLLEYFGKLDEEGQKQLLEYAEFLQIKYPSSPDKKSDTPLEPLPSVAPENESVPAAIKRLSRSYPMLDKVKMMNPTASLMTQYLTQGREAELVIADLEALFKNEYSRYLEDFDKGSHDPAESK